MAPFVSGLGRVNPGAPWPASAGPAAARKPRPGGTAQLEFPAVGRALAAWAGGRRARRGRGLASPGPARGSPEPGADQLIGPSTLAAASRVPCADLAG
jgi:hypothetical protein